MVGNHAYKMRAFRVQTTKQQTFNTLAFNKNNMQISRIIYVVFTKNRIVCSRLLVIYRAGLYRRTEPKETLQQKYNYLGALLLRQILHSRLFPRSLCLPSNLRLQHCPTWRPKISANKSNKTSAGALSLETANTLESCEEIQCDFA